MDDKRDSTPLQESHETNFQIPSRSCNPVLYLIASSASLMMFTSGIAMSWTSPVLPKLSDKAQLDTNPLGRTITPGEEAWIGGLLSFGAVLGPLAAGPLADTIGRKRALIVIALPMTFSFLLTAFAKNIALFYIARILMGAGAASVFTVLPMFLGEIAEDHNRGSIGCLVSVFLTSGILFSYAIGPFLSLRTFCLTCLSPLLLFAITYPNVIPETPQFLAYSGDVSRVQASLLQLRNKSFEEVQEESERLLRNSKGRKRKGKLVDLFKLKSTRKGLILTLTLTSLQQLSGIRAVFAYLQMIFEAAETGWAPEISTIIVGVIQVVATVVSSVLVDRLGRKFLLLVSAVASCISLVLLGVYFWVRSDSISWLPILSLILYITAFNIGLGPIPWAMLAELFPHNVKSSASTIVNVACFSVAFVVTFAFPHIKVLVGLAQSFWFFATVCAVGAIFVYREIPETKGKSVDEIQDILGGRKGTLVDDNNK